MLETTPGEGHNEKNNCEKIMENIVLEKYKQHTPFVPIKGKSTLN